tara:strand:+ start:626 stop:820 length:195 start_codon:yes stop_codon:yes gene_type:complete
MYTISERINLTIGNIKHQKNVVLWDDLEKLEEVLNRVKELEQENETLKARILNLKYGIEIKTNK